MDDVTCIILGLCDCGSSFKSWTLVCKKWNRIAVMLFPTADVLFANPVKTLMKLWDLKIDIPSKWFSFQENLDILKKYPNDTQTELFVCGGINPNDRIRALGKGMICPSYLSSDLDIIAMFSDSHGSSGLLLTNLFFQRHPEYLNEYIISNCQLINNTSIMCAVVKGSISLDFSFMLSKYRIPFNVISYHKDYNKGLRSCDKNYNPRDFRLQRYIECCLAAGWTIPDLWKRMVEQSDDDDGYNASHYIDSFLQNRIQSVDLKFYMTEMAHLVNNDDKTYTINTAFGHCKYTWKDVVMYERLFKNRSDILEFVAQNDSL